MTKPEFCRASVSDDVAFRRMELAGADDIDGQAGGRVSGSERVKRPAIIGDPAMPDFLLVKLRGSG
jgi:hypothetical protein